MGHNSEQIKSRINDMIIKTIITGYPTLSRMQQSSHPQNFANDMCFEILGFDVFLNHKLNPYIIEINYTPSFSVDTPFDKMVKKGIIYDTLKIMNLSEKWKKEVRKKRELEIRERMLSGKRSKYTIDERQELMRKCALLRDEHEKENMGGFTKIFCHNQDQMLKYAHYYEFAEILYQKDNKITGVTTSKSYVPFYMPFAEPKSPASKKQFIKTSNTVFSSTKIINRRANNGEGRMKSIENNRKIISAKNVPLPRTPPFEKASIGNEKRPNQQKLSFEQNLGENGKEQQNEVKDGLYSDGKDLFNESSERGGLLLKAQDTSTQERAFKNRLISTALDGEEIRISSVEKELQKKVQTIALEVIDV